MAAGLLYAVPQPQWILTYAGVNITADISQMVTSVEYTDKLGGASGELQVVIEDSSRKWQGPWYPTKGDVVSALIGYAGQPMLPTGDFQVDEMEIEGAPDTMHLRCIAAYITDALRTHNSIGYENQTLLQIATTIAGKYGLTVVDAAVPLNLTFARVSQAHETDLVFLKRIANDHGYDFTVRGTQLIFYARQTLEAAAPVLTISRTPIPGAIAVKQQNGYHFKDGTNKKSYKNAQVSYFDPIGKKLITATATDPNGKTNDTLKVPQRSENGAQATLKAQAQLHAANMHQLEASLTTIGDYRLCAGNIVAVTGWGAVDGAYLIQTARHTITSAGYDTKVEARNVASA